MVTSSSGQKSFWLPIEWPSFIRALELLTLLEDKVKNLEGVEWPERGMNSCLVNEYLPSQGILPHTDGPAYHPLVLTLSLAGPATLHFTPDILSDQFKNFRAEEIPKSFEVNVEEGSLLVLTKDLYECWRHEIRGEEQRERRVSLTFRRVRRSGNAALVGLGTRRK
ncbi:hypothetical protein BT69DRAFT_1289339 [Atractiella rhizophila]|nr:hypothetical protein BT69DRAFT_1289339 [Atractiella rhizophila]